MKHHHLTILAAILCATFALAQNTPVAPPNGKAKPRAASTPAVKDASAKSKEDDRVIIEHVDNLNYDPKTKIYHMTGNVVFANKDMKLYCDEADYNEEADTAKARGHLRAVDPRSVITGDLLDADFGKDLAIITGNVLIVTQKKGNKVEEKPKPGLEKPPAGSSTLASNEPGAAPEKAAADKSGKSNEPEHLEDYWKNKTTITCERLEYYYADDVKKMIATPRVKAIQEDKTVWADHAVYEDLTSLITLTGNVILTKTNGDVMRCNKAVVSTEEDWIQAEGMSGVTLRKKKTGNENPPEPKAGPSEPAGPAPSDKKPAEPAPAPASAKPTGGMDDSGG
ncbi:MAG: OstA-like protein [Armatimonadia bacterium]